MSGEKNYIYDSTVKNKPWNSNALYLNINTFKEKQNNMTNAEAQLVLDNNTIRALNDVNGTLCINRLIQNWRNVSGAGDMFRNLGVNNLDAALTKEQKSIVEIDQANAINIAMNSPYNLSRSFGANYKDDGASHWGIFGLEFDGDGDVYDYLEGKRDWTRIYRAYDNREKDHYHIWDTITDKQGMAIFQMLTNTTSADAAATNVIFDQLKGMEDNLFFARFGFDRKKSGDLNYRLMQAAVREATFDRTALYDQGALEKLVSDKCFYYKNHMDEFEELYPNQMLLDGDGNYAIRTKELIRQDIIKGINNNDLANCLLGKNSISKPTSNNPNTVYSDVNNNEISVINTINILSHFCTLKNLDMYAKCLNDNLGPASAETIIKELNEGNSIIAEFENCTLTSFKNGITSSDTKKIDGKAQFTIVGVWGTSYIVSYEGKSWLLNPNDKSNNMKFGGCYSIKIATESDITSYFKYGENPFYGIRDKLSVNNNQNYEYGKMAAFVANNPGYEGWLNARDNNSNGNKLLDVLDEMANRGSRDFNRIDMLVNKYLNHPEEFERKYHIPLFDDQGKVNRDLIALDYYKEFGDKMLIDYSNADDLRSLTEVNYLYYIDNVEQYKKDFNIAEGTKIMNDGIYDNCKNRVDEQAKANLAKGINVMRLAFNEKNAKYYREDVEKENEKFAYYCSVHGDQVSHMSFDRLPTCDEIMKAQESGYDIFFRCEDMTCLEDENGKQVQTLGLGELRSKELKILDVVSDKDAEGNINERYCVSCNGKKYYYSPAKHALYYSDFSAIKIS